MRLNVVECVGLTMYHREAMGWCMLLRFSWNLDRGVTTVEKKAPVKKAFKMEKLEERIAPSSAKFPPGQFPSGNPAKAPGNSNPNEHPK